MSGLEIAGLGISAIGLINDLLQTYRDLAEWDEKDVEVDRDWLEVAIAKGVLQGSAADYGWMSIKRLPTAELRESHNAVIAINKEKRLKYRVVQGSATRGEVPNILVRKKQ